jgi:uncharacterized cofD-like protein
MKKKIVTIGGGTGQVPLLSGLKDYPYDITAVVTMADDGGSTGRLRDELGVLPPGDAMKCLVALSDAPNMLRTLMNYRFEDGGLKGHSMGNLLVSALEKVNGSFSQGMHEAARILRVRGRVLPSSEGDMRLNIFLNDGTVLEGETHLDDHPKVRDIGIDHVELSQKVSAYEEVLTALRDADYVIIGPGDLYGSIVPNLLVDGLAQTLCQSEAQCVFIAPLTNKRGHSEGFDIERYVQAIERYIGKGCIDYVIANNAHPDNDTLRRYEVAEGKKSLVTPSADNARNRTYQLLVGDILSLQDHGYARGDALAATRALIRHDSAKLGSAVSYLIEYGGNDPFDIL